MEAGARRGGVWSWTKGRPSGALLTALVALCALVACSRASDKAQGKSERVGTTSQALSASVQANFASPSVVTVTYSSAQTAGDLNVVAVGWNDTIATVTSVTDVKGNTYALAAGPLAVSGTFTQAIYYAKNIAAAAANANVVTVNFSGPAAFPDVRIAEYKGLDPTSPLDVVAQQTGTGTTLNSGSVTTTSAKDLLVAAGFVKQAITGAGSGFTSRIITANKDDLEDEAVTATGSYHATAPQSPADAWIMQMAAFKVASGATASFVQVHSATPSAASAASPSSVAVPYLGAQSAGDLNFVSVGWSDTTATVTSVGDSAGNTYSLAVGPATLSGTLSQAIYYAKNVVSSAANVVTVHFSVPATGPYVAVVEYSGLDPSAPVDVTAQHTGTGTTTSSGAVTTVNANDLLVAANTVQTVTTGPGTGFTTRILTTDGNLVEDEAVTSAGSYTATAPCSPSGGYAMQMVAFKVASAGGCTGAPNGTACNDGNACTQTDTCQGGVCTGANPVTCTASDQCHAAGTCDTGTGVCSNPVATNGTACNDGNACTQTDTCQSGTCTGANPVTCTASDQCHTAGTCNTSTGACSNPVATNGTACNDGNACTQTDTCQSGTCTGANPVTCTASDQCHTAGTCNTGTGACSNPVATNGTACNDGNACTQTDTCQAGPLCQRA